MVRCRMNNACYLHTDMDLRRAVSLYRRLVGRGGIYRGFGHPENVLSYRTYVGVLDLINTVPRFTLHATKTSRDPLIKSDRYDEVCSCKECDGYVGGLDHEDWAIVPKILTDRKTGICRDCLHYCEHCHESVLPSEYTEVSTDIGEVGACDTCRSEWDECDDCEIYLLDSNSCGSNADDNRVCESCAEDYFFCERCEETRHTNDYGSDGKCTECEPNLQFNESWDFSQTAGIARFIGVEIECYTRSRPEDSSGEWDVGTDGTICPTEGKQGWEVRTHPAQGKAFVRIIDSLCAELDSCDVGVNRSCGLHVHLDARHLTRMEKSNIWRWWRVFEPAIYLLVSESRRGKNQFCRSARTHTDTRYCTLNRHSEHETIEFRLHQGTTSAQKITWWVRFLLRFVEWSRHLYCPDALRHLRRFMCGDVPVKLLKRLIRLLYPTRKACEITRADIAYTLDRVEALNGAIMRTQLERLLTCAQSEVSLLKTRAYPRKLLQDSLRRSCIMVPLEVVNRGVRSRGMVYDVRI